jgi:hypothetical protein
MFLRLIYCTKNVMYYTTSNIFTDEYYSHLFILLMIDICGFFSSLEFSWKVFFTGHLSNKHFAICPLNFGLPFLLYFFFYFCTMKRITIYLFLFWLRFLFYLRSLCLTQCHKALFSYRSCKILGNIYTYCTLC